MKRRTLSIAAAALLSSFVIGCGSGSGSDSTSTDTSSLQSGYFLDSAVEGIKYVRIDENGTVVDSNVTNEDGMFYYLLGELVRFQVGNVVLGTLTPKEIVTPEDFNETDYNTTGSINRVRFLVGIDSDKSKPGIQISETMKAKAKYWKTVTSDQFSDVNFTEILEEATSQEVNESALATVEEATEHIEETMSCVYSGAFLGTWNSQASALDKVITADGTWAMVVTPKNNVYIAASDGDSYMAVTDASRDLKSKSFKFSASNYTLDSILSGDINGSGAFVDTDTIYATYSNDYRIMGISATKTTEINASRVGSAIDTVYRYVGAYYYDKYVYANHKRSSGFVTMDIDDSYTITGLLYDYSTQSSESLTGEVVEGSFDDDYIKIEATAGDKLVSGYVILNYEDESGTAISWSDSYERLTWTSSDENATSTSGVIWGSGCKLKQ